MFIHNQNNDIIPFYGSQLLFNIFVTIRKQLPSGIQLNGRLDLLISRYTFPAPQARKKRRIHAYLLLSVHGTIVLHFKHIHFFEDTTLSPELISFCPFD